MDSTDLEVVNVLVFQQLLESVESESWAEAAMALYKLYDIEGGLDFLDQTTSTTNSFWPPDRSVVLSRSILLSTVVPELVSATV